jgi:hypothetical protein
MKALQLVFGSRLATNNPILNQSDFSDRSRQAAMIKFVVLCSLFVAILTFLCPPSSDDGKLPPAL